jgi:hypothetical protein
VVDELSREVTRLADRLRTLSDVRLAQPLPAPASGSRADAAHALAQLLADLGADLEGEQHRPVPRLHDFAVADQVAVTGTDLLRALAGAACAGASASASARAAGHPAAVALEACRALRALLT